MPEVSFDHFRQRYGAKSRHLLTQTQSFVADEQKSPVSNDGPAGVRSELIPNE